ERNFEFSFVFLESQQIHADSNVSLDFDRMPHLHLRRRAGRACFGRHAQAVVLLEKLNMSEIEVCQLMVEYDVNHMPQDERVRRLRIRWNERAGLKEDVAALVDRSRINPLGCLET